MTAPPERILQKVRQWAAYGDEDLALAQHALRMGEQSPHRLVAYHAQQCAEKYLKAYLVHRGVDFPFTHNMSLLLELCAKSAVWAEVLEDAESLTRYAITTRYPGEGPDVSPEKARAAVEIAARVRETVREAFVKEGITLKADG
ncbi:MAG: HEPN domain-containing protein [Phycisphaerae bacterium]|nr:HEPN domain-containing protein [Phycisphaerae bacterium]